MSATEALAPSLHLAISAHGVGAVLTVLEAMARSRSLRGHALGFSRTLTLGRIRPKRQRLLRARNRIDLSHTRTSACVRIIFQNLHELYNMFCFVVVIDSLLIVIPEVEGAVARKKKITA